MRDIKKLNLLFEYQKFSRNSSLKTKIDEVNARYISQGVELADNILDVSAAGEPNLNSLISSPNSLDSCKENASPLTGEDELK